MISKTTIDKIFETMRVEEVIGDFIRLKKAGTSYKALSPFTNERTPSFYVSPAKQIFKCFSSGIGGNAITFLMEYEKLSYPEALRYVAKKYGIEIEEDILTPEDEEAKNEEESLFIVNEWAKRWFQEQLWNTEEGRNIGLAYFRERGFTDDTIQKFQLGYSPASYTAMVEASRKAGFNADYLLTLGLIKKNEKGDLYDSFRERVIFPILDRGSRTAGFAGRIMSTHTKAAKYINSPESPIYNKGRILYGIGLARKAISKEDMCLLAEGYTDVLSLHQAGIENVVASSGTSLTEDQVRLIRQMTSNVGILFDGDPAGIRASQRGIDMFLKEDIDVKVLLFPEGDDPDSFCRKHSPVEVRDHINAHLEDFVRFKARIMATRPTATPTQKIQAARELLESIALMRGELKQSVYLKEASQILDIDQTILATELSTILARNALQVEKEKKIRQKSSELIKVHTEQANSIVSNLHTIERQLLWLLVNFGNKHETFRHPFEEGQIIEGRIGELIYFSLEEDNLGFETDDYVALAQVIFSFFKENNRFPESNDYVKHQHIAPLYAELSSISFKISPNWEARGIYVTDFNALLEIDTIETILRFKDIYLRRDIENLTSLLPTIEDSNEYDNTSRSIITKINLRRKINTRLRRVVG